MAAEQGENKVGDMFGEGDFLLFVGVLVLPEK